MGWPTAQELMVPLDEIKAQGLAFLDNKDNGYLLAGIFALLFPILRFALDRLVFAVSPLISFDKADLF
jgi:hypothetical protein